MSFPDFIDISSDEENEATEAKDVKPTLQSHCIQILNYEVTQCRPDLEEYYVKQSIQAEISHNVANGVTCDSYQAELGSNPTDGLCPASSSQDSPVALCRQFWKSGEYETGRTPAPVHHSGKNRLRIHPKFLHSNATSHKWAFGAIAELLDNAVDEVQNRATFVIVDKFINPRNGEAALLIQDDGGGMDPESLRRCMSFGFSDKQSDATIGQYGNGFKTSTMRLGADVIVFSRCSNNRVLTQSVGLLSYTFLRQTGCDDIVVPVVDYVFDQTTGAFARLLRSDEKQFSTNLSTFLRWSPFASEYELLEQFNDIGRHGTKVIVFSLWYNDDGQMELDFESDSKDILINKTQTDMRKNAPTLTRKNISNRLKYSLRAYSSILYLCIPETFKIILRGEVVIQHHVVNDLIYMECVVYRPQVEGYPAVLTTIGFVDGAPNVDVHGFNVYHKNRLILPFWRVANNSYGKGRGVVGVLEANFVKPTHDKQDFEKSSIYQKLENRLKEMTYEYWDLHCYLIGYKPKVALPNMSSSAAPAYQMLPRLGTSVGIRQSRVNHGLVAGTTEPQVVMDLRIPTDTSHTTRQLTIYNSQEQTGLSQKRKQESHISTTKSIKKQAFVIRSAARLGGNHKAQLEESAEQKRRHEMKTMMLENKKLREQCLEFEGRGRELLLKEEKLGIELRSFQQLYEKLTAELNSLDEVKVEKL